MTPEERRVRLENAGDPKRRDRFGSTYEQRARSPFVAHAVAAFERAFALLEAMLAAGGPWIKGYRPTLGDIALMSYVARLHFLDLLDRWIKARPHVGAL